MIWVRKADLVIQAILSGLMVISLPTGLFLFMTDLFFLGCLQLVSALCNTYSFYRAGFGKFVFYYWLSAFVCLIMLFTGGRAGIDELMYVALFAAGCVAIFYWINYKRLISHLQLKKELGGFTKSN